MTRTLFMTDEDLVADLRAQRDFLASPWHQWLPYNPGREGTACAVVRTENSGARVALDDDSRSLVSTVVAWSAQWDHGGTIAASDWYCSRWNDRARPGKRRVLAVLHAAIERAERGWL